VKPRNQNWEKRAGANERVYTHQGHRVLHEEREASRRAYNVFVPDAQRQNDSSHKHQRHAVYATETSGLLLVAVLLLVLILVRYWHAIHWSVR
jgi:hypothetical protein